MLERDSPGLCGSERAPATRDATDCRQKYLYELRLIFGSVARDAVRGVSTKLLTVSAEVLRFAASALLRIVSSKLLNAPATQATSRRAHPDRGLACAFDHEFDVRYGVIGGQMNFFFERAMDLIQPIEVAFLRASTARPTR